MTSKSKPIRRRQRRRWFQDMTVADYILSAVGLCLGTAAALFPWHVYLHPDSYGPPLMTFSRGGVIPDSEILALQSGHPVFDMRSGRFVQDLPTSGSSIDPVTTGKVDKDAEAGPGDLEQAFPDGDLGFQVIAVDGARALVGDSGGVYLIRPRNRLPNGATVQSFARDEQGWYILTTDNRLLRPTP